MLYTFEVLALPKSIITMHANVCLDLQKFQFVKSGNVYIYIAYIHLYIHRYLDGYVMHIVETNYSYGPLH